jgi:hypothetical protein
MQTAQGANGDLLALVDRRSPHGRMRAVSRLTWASCTP